jgi:hypothetical protein
MVSPNMKRERKKAAVRRSRFSEEHIMRGSKEAEE